MKISFLIPKGYDSFVACKSKHLSSLNSKSGKFKCHRYKIGAYLFLPILFICNTSCAHRRHYKKHKKESLAVIKPLNKSQVRGWVHFQKSKKKKQVLVKAEITGLKPNKEYGFHIHQYGDCRENGKNAGAHWNPKGHAHGSPDSPKRHWGDLGNLKANAKGKAVYENTVKMCLYKTGGRSLIIHANKDDLKSQPSGNAGPYIACGVVGYIKAKTPNKAKKEAKATKKEAKATKKEAKATKKEAKATKKEAKVPKKEAKATKKEAKVPKPQTPPIDKE